jgi:hypothetical protein
VRHLLGVKENSIQNIKMSAPSAVVVPNSTNGAASQAAAVTPVQGGGAVITPLPLNGGRRHRSKKLSKKVLNMFKKGSRGKLMKMMKGGSAALSPAQAGGRRTRRHSRKH